MSFDLIDRKFGRKPEADESHCDVCKDIGWVDDRLGGEPTSGWTECPDCHNPEGNPSP